MHVGTEAALLAGQPLVNVNEDAPLRPDSKALYSATKAMAEQAVRDANADGFETVVVRPRLVWGAGDTTILPALVAAVEKRRFSWIGGGPPHVDHARRQHGRGPVLGAERGRPGGVYFVTDGEPVVFREFVTELLGTQGVSRRTATSGAVARVAAAASERSGACCAAPATRRSRASPTGSRRRSARSTSPAPARSSATSRCARVAEGMEELRREHAAV